MKKISLLMALALCMTITGVYATWNYVTAEGESTVSENALTIEMAEINTTKSIFTTEFNIPAFTLTVDEYVDYNKSNDASKLYDTHPVLTPTQDLIIDFALSDAAQKTGDTVLVEGTYTVEVRLEIVANPTYNNQSIFTAATPIAVLANVSLTFDSDNNPQLGGQTQITIPYSELQAALAMNTFNLPTEADYNAFQTALSSASVKIVVEQIASPSEP